MKSKFLAISLLFFSLTAMAQVKETWQVSLPGNVNWQQVTVSGNYLVGTTEALVCLNPTSGQTIWSLPNYANVASEQVVQHGGSPLITVNGKGTADMLNPFTGEVTFSSRTAGITEILDTYYLLKSNGVLISGKNSAKKPIMVYADLSTGKVEWRLDEDFGRLVNATELNRNETLITTLWNIYRVNSRTGKQVYKASTTDVQMKGAMGNLMKTLVSNVMDNVEMNVKFYRHPAKEIFYIASEQQKQSAMGSTATNAQILYKTEYHAFDLNTGKRLWKEPLEVDGKIGQLYFHSKGLIPLPDNGQNTTVNIFDYSTKEGLWGKKGRGLRIKGGVYDYVSYATGLLLLSKSNDKNFLSYLDVQKGILTFDKPVKIDGEVVFTTKTSKGVLYCTTEEMNILDLASGALFLPKSIPTNPRLTADTGDQLYVFDLKENNLKLLDKNTGKLISASPSIAFEGKESPKGIELKEQGIFIYSDQNVALIDYKGPLLYQKYYEAPREPGLKRALLYAEAVRAAYIGANAQYASAQLKAATPQISQRDAATGALISGLGDAYGQLGDAATDFAKRSFQQASKRFKATTQARDFMVILYRQENKRNALIKVSKLTGEIEALIDLGKERMPVYTMDDVTGQVFYRTAATTVSGYDLN